jgi:hypothetical protein
MIREHLSETVALTLDKSFASFHVATVFSTIHFSFGTNNEQTERIGMRIARLKKRRGRPQQHRVEKSLALVFAGCKCMK